MQVNSLISKITKGFTAAQTPWSQKVSLVLNGALVLFVLYWIFLVVSTPFYVKQMKESVPQVGLGEMQTLPPLQDLSAYQDVVTQYPIFGVAKQAVSGPVRSACDEFKTKYILSGIIGGAENEALFNSKSGKQTYFAKSGELIEGVTIESVSAHSVVLNCSGQSVEMVIEET